MDNQSTFTNDIVDVPALPALQMLEMHAVSPRFRTMNVLFIVFITSIHVSVMFALRYQSWFDLPEGIIDLFPFILGAIVSLDLMWMIYHIFADPRIAYAVREHDISLRKGLLFKTLTCQPVLRIQHVELKRGPIERLAGLSTLSLYSAGGDSYTFSIPGLPEETAQTIRQFILKHKDVNAS